MKNHPVYGNVIIFGASSGIGLAAAEYFQDKCQNLFTVSRRPSPFGKWIAADLTQAQEIEKLRQALSDQPIDALLYLGGTWEKGAFTEEYDFEHCTDADLENVLNVNLLAPIRVVQKLLPNLKKSEHAKIILMGAALDSLDHKAYREVANTSSKYGLKGMVAALRQSLKPYSIGVSLINPGNVATAEVIHDLESMGLDASYAIPISDLLRIMEMILQLSNRSNINEIDLPSMR